MRKLRKFQLNDVTRLSNQEMQNVIGGDFMVYDNCDATNVGKACVYNFSASEWGVCKFETSSDGQSIRYYCAKRT